MGRAMGMAAPIQSISAVGAFLAGWYRDEMGTYTTFFQLTALGFFLIIPLMLLIPRQSVDVSA
jgi:preprotein translocase subunit SecD